jgi:hypothetical protein
VPGAQHSAVLGQYRDDLLDDRVGVSLEALGYKVTLEPAA